MSVDYYADDRESESRAEERRDPELARLVDGPSSFAPHAEAYACSECGATEVRLFRDYRTFDLSTRCAKCLEGAGVPRLRRDRFEGWVPAVPDGNGSFWGYSYVPDVLVYLARGAPLFPAGTRSSWWYGLPESQQ